MAAVPESRAKLDRSGYARLTRQSRCRW